MSDDLYLCKRKHKMELGVCFVLVFFICQATYICQATNDVTKDLICLDKFGAS